MSRDAESQPAHGNTPPATAELNCPPVAYAALDARGRISEINGAASRLLGRSGRQLRGWLFTSFITERSEQRTFNAQLRASRPLAKRPRAGTAEFHLRCAGHRTRLVEITTLPFYEGAGGLLLALADVSAPLQVEKELLRASEHEKGSLGHDLHDGVCQQLMGVAMMAQSFAEACERRSRAADAAKMRQLSDLVRDACQQAREVAQRLRPLECESSGLSAALENLAARQSGHGIRCRMLGGPLVLVRDPEAALHLFRIAEEAVENARRHSRAQRIDIALTETAHQIILTVSDDGSGFRVTDTKAASLGIRLMRHRARLIGAALAIESAPSRGTLIRCALPSS